MIGPEENVRHFRWSTGVTDDLTEVVLQMYSELICVLFTLVLTLYGFLQVPWRQHNMPGICKGPWELPDPDMQVLTEVHICPTLQMQVLWCRQLVILGDVFVKNVWLWTSESKKTTNPAKGVKEKTPNILFHSLHAGGPLWSISRFWILKHLDRSWALCNHYNYDGCHFTGLQCGPAYHHYSDCIIASWLSGLMLGRMRCVGWVGQHDFANMSSFNQTLGSMLEARASQLVFNDWPIGLPFDAMLQKLCCQNSNRSPAHQLVWVFLGCDVRLI